MLSPSGGDTLAGGRTAVAAYSAIRAVCRELAGYGWSHVRIFAWWAVQGAADGLSRQRLNEVLAVSRFHLPHVSVAMMRNIAPRLSNLTPSGEKRGRPRATPERERMPERRSHCAPARYFSKKHNGTTQIQTAQLRHKERRQQEFSN